MKDISRLCDKFPSKNKKISKGRKGRAKKSILVKDSLRDIDKDVGIMVFS